MADHDGDDDDTTPAPENPDATDTVAGPARRRRRRSVSPPGRFRRSSSHVIVDRYVFGKLIGRGGQGEIVEAHDHQLDRTVAIKRMRDEHPDTTDVERFLREARIQGRLDHPAIVPVYELGRDRGGRPFFAMKQIAGTMLVSILSSHGRGGPRASRERFTRQRLLRAFADVCLAIEFAHSRGVIHRDLKPANIALGDFGEVYLLDWGIARTFDDPAAGEPTPVGAVTHGETIPGQQIGTPGYMAPEQIQAGVRLDGRVDVYALGCVLFEILAGQPLHPPGSDPARVVDARPSVRAPDRDVPPELDALCVAATMVDRETRIATARELGDRVQAFLDGDRDVQARQDLARDHLALALAAVAGGRDDDAARRTAMLEAGRALALDPTLNAAADLIGRLMLRPPTETPPELVAEMQRDDDANRKRFARMSVIGYLGLLAFVPVIFWIGLRDVRYIAAMLALIAVNWAASWLGMRRPRYPGRPVVVLAIHAFMIVLLARMFSPILIAPGAAAVIAMVLVGNPSFATRPRRVAAIVVMMAAAALPLAAELAGLIPRTVLVIGNELVVRPPAVISHAGPSEISLMLWAIAVIGIAGATAGFTARAERDAQHRLRLQAWQLRQLVDDRGAQAA